MPKQLGPYRILGRLGKGGMNYVLRAVHVALKREVALKVLPPQHAAQAKKLARFKRESRLAGNKLAGGQPCRDYLPVLMLAVTKAAALHGL